MTTETLLAVSVSLLISAVALLICVCAWVIWRWEREP